jgi:hypothetical protein
LEVHAAQRRGFVVVGQVELGEGRAQAAIVELLDIPDLGKEPAIIVKPIGLNDPASLNVCLNEFHSAQPLKQPSNNSDS